MTHYAGIPEKPLNAGFSGNVENINRVYFFKRENGTVFAVQSDEEAWGLWNKRNQVLGKERERIELIGTGDGKLFNKAILESGELFKTQGLEAAQERIRQGEQEELEACRGKIIPPPDMDFYSLGSDRRGVDMLRNQL